MTKDPRRGFLVGFVVLWAGLYGLGRVGATSIDLGVASAAGILCVAYLVQRWVFGQGSVSLSTQLGLGRPSARGMYPALLVAALLVATLPVYSALADEHLHVRKHWLWLVVGLFAYHGVAEELCWRGYAYGHLRLTRTFRGAVIATMPLIVMTHLAVVLEAGVVVGAAALVIAAVTCLPLAHLYELGGRTIWPAAVVHAAIDSFSLLVDPGAGSGLTLAVSAAALTLPFVAFAWRRAPLPDQGPPTTERDALVSSTRKESS